MQNFYILAPIFGFSIEETCRTSTAPQSNHEAALKTGRILSLQEARWYAASYLCIERSESSVDKFHPQNEANEPTSLGREGFDGIKHLSNVVPTFLFYPRMYYLPYAYMPQNIRL